MGGRVWTKKMDVVELLLLLCCFLYVLLKISWKKKATKTFLYIFDNLNVEALK
jgi:hypothetical protein